MLWIVDVDTITAHLVMSLDMVFFSSFLVKAMTAKKEKEAQKKVLKKERKSFRTTMKVWLFIMLNITWNRLQKLDN